MKDGCPDCKAPQPPLFMLWDKVWAAAGLDHDDGWFCIGCVEERLGRKLVLADFNNARCNYLLPTVREHFGFAEMDPAFYDHFEMEDL